MFFLQLDQTFVTHVILQRLLVGQTLSVVQTQTHANALMDMYRSEIRAVIRNNIFLFLTKVCMFRLMPNLVIKILFNTSSRVYFIKKRYAK